MLAEGRDEPLPTIRPVKGALQSIKAIEESRRTILVAGEHREANRERDVGELAIWRGLPWLEQLEERDDQGQGAQDGDHDVSNRGERRPVAAPHEDREGERRPEVDDRIRIVPIVEHSA